MAEQIDPLTQRPYEKTPFGAGNPLVGDAVKVPDHVARMAVETQDVVKRLRSLTGFMETKTFKELPDLDKALLYDQKEQMTDYAKTLSLRYCMALLDHG